MANRTATRLARATAVNVVVAWRLFIMTLLGRNQPEMAPEVMLSELKIQGTTGEVPQAAPRKPCSIMPPC